VRVLQRGDCQQDADEEHQGRHAELAQGMNGREVLFGFILFVAMNQIPDKPEKPQAE